MNADTPSRALLVVFAVALLCSILVSVAAITLRPVQERNALVERSRHIVALTGLVEPGRSLDSAEILEVVEALDVRLVDIDRGEFTTELDAETFDARAATLDPAQSVAIAAGEDLARLGRRARFARIYLVWEDDALKRVILPIHGQGMWSTLRGFVALEADLNTIGAATFYEQAETAGLGDQIQSPDWLALWSGRRIFGGDGSVRFRVAPGAVAPGSATAAHEVDAISGATATGDSVSRIVRFWFGASGFGAFLTHLAESPPVRTATEKQA